MSVPYWKRNLWLLWLSQLLGFMGYSAALPFIPLFMKQKYNIIDDKELGLYVSAFYFITTFALALVSPIWGIIADRYGRKLMLVRAFFGNAVVFPLLAFAPTIGILLVFRAIASVFSGSINAAQTLIVSNTPEEHQGYALGVFSTSVWCGNMMGLVFGGVTSHIFTYQTSFIACGVLYFIGGIMTLWVHENFSPVKKERQSKFSQFKVLSKAGIIVAGLFVMVGILRNIETPFLPLKVVEIVGENKAGLMTGILGACAAAGGVISGFLLGKLADRMRPLQLMLPVLALSGAMLAGQGASKAMWLLMLCRFLAFVAAGGIEPILQVILSRVTPQENRGGAFGMAMTARMFGIMLSSVIGGFIQQIWNVNGVFIAGGILFAALIPLVVCAFRKIAVYCPESMQAGNR